MIAQTKRTPSMRVTWRVLVLFVVLTLALTWPVVAHLSTMLPGTATWAFDESTFVWNIWYFKHALLDLHSSPLHSDLIWHPLGIDLVLHTYNLFNALAGMPLLLAFNAVVASNITVLLATALSGLGAYLLALDVLRRAHAGTGTNHLQLAALIAGLIYAFASNRAIYAALGHYDLVSTQWLPFYALYFLRAVHRPKLKHAVLAGLFFAFAALAEMSLASFLALLSLVLLLASWRGLRHRRRALAMVGLAALIAVTIWSPVLVPIAREFIGGDYALEGWGESIKLERGRSWSCHPDKFEPAAGGQRGQRSGLAGCTACRGKRRRPLQRHQYRVRWLGHVGARPGRCIPGPETDGPMDPGRPWFLASLFLVHSSRSTGATALALTVCFRRA